jgi:hypothetical protein
MRTDVFRFHFQPLSLPLMSRRSYQQGEHPARLTKNLESLALEIYQHISVQAEEASFKLDEERIIAPLGKYPPLYLLTATVIY